MSNINTRFLYRQIEDDLHVISDAFIIFYSNLDKVGMPKDMIRRLLLDFIDQYLIEFLKGDSLGVELKVHLDEIGNLYGSFFTKLNNKNISHDIIECGLFLTNNRYLKTLE